VSESRSATPFSSEKPSANDRLDSWKEIAAYLKREVRTVQRWEKSEDLPVYRHTHSERGSVYAYKTELDAWWNNRRPRLEQETQTRAGFRWRLWLPAAAAAALAVVLGVSLWLAQRPRLAFQQRDWVLTATFENRTGEPIFDGTLEYALERELSNSRFVNVVPRERIADALGLMRKPMETHIDAALGREICLRDGGIRALLTGRIERMGSAYLLSARLIDPVSGATVASVSEEAASQDAILGAIRQLSNRVRKALGEQLPHIQESTEKLEKVTTPSLRALQHYTEGMALVNKYKWEPAAEMLRRAVAEDSEFASAHILLAWALRNQVKPDWVLKRERNPEQAFGRQRKLETEWRAHSERALQLAANASDRERYFILGSYYSQRRQYEEALPYYETLVHLYPDDYWGTNNCALTYESLGRWREAVQYAVRRAEMRPHDSRSNLYAAQRLAVWGNDLAGARPYLQRVRTLDLSDDLRKWLPGQFFVAWMELLPAWEDWLAGDLPRAERELTRVAQTLTSRTGFELDAFAYSVALFYLRLGKLRDAEETCKLIWDNGGRPECLAVVAWERNDKSALRKYLQEAGTEWPPFSPFYDPLLVQAGLLSEAGAAITRYEIEGSPSRFHQSARGQLALARGDARRAIELLQDGNAAVRLQQTVVFLSGAESLARAWAKRGDLQKAIQVLEDASQEKSRPNLTSGALWLRVRFLLAQLYRKVGREEEARRIEVELLNLLALADRDHPMLLALQRSQGLTGLQPSR